MMFHIFKDQDERSAFGGSQLLEFQYCRMSPGQNVKHYVSVDALEFWKTDSLYLDHDDFGRFTEQYGHIIRGGVYNNLKTGPVDDLGINYFSPEQTEEIVDRLEREIAADPLLLDWLKKARACNGFYILGI